MTNPGHLVDGQVHEPRMVLTQCLGCAQPLWFDTTRSDSKSECDACLARAEAAKAEAETAKAAKAEKAR